MNRVLILITLCLTLTACSKTGMNAPWENTQVSQASSPVPEIKSASELTNLVDGSEMRYVPAGEFGMGNDESAYTVYVEGFYIHAYEVTNQQYAQFLNAIGNQSDGGSPWLKFEDREVRIHQINGVWQADASYEDHPVIEENWYGANAYCLWLGGRLPTEAEWEKAARGGLEGERYPWGGRDPVCDLGAKNGARFRKCGRLTAPVGVFGANGYGLYDMAGNVWEWTGSCFQDYPEHVSDAAVDLASGCSFVLRGGCWGSSAGTVQVFSRSGSLALSHDHHLGFRCVVTP